ncbi:hypothetical protein BDF20DRAFT_824508 [Mycotypha africana]|uniref:uncharacterized protein n=1 Tax=Mycotypha africana TaxID=64632 RepID=UPI002300257F|nr:uncharacterized protein BDF20DRAFT_824508 [Mycotypha africana]KAI8971628.1 hypothetical protein BDF20DRAFT_824508 [Mycotypha africana]
MSPKSRRTQKRGLAEEARPRPRLHAHHRIRSDPVQVEPPLTIDQHLSNYHQSLGTFYQSHRQTPSTTTTTTISTTHSSSNSNTNPFFYQYRPLIYTAPKRSKFPFTLLHPEQSQQRQQQPKETMMSNVSQNQNNDGSGSSDNSSGRKRSSSSGLLQLAHIVSTFG